MALFIAELAFATPERLASAKLGILVASLVAGVGGIAVLTVGRADEAAADDRQDQNSGRG